VNGKAWRALVAAVSIALAAMAGVGCGGDDDDTGTPTPLPAYYLTASSAADLRHQAYDAAARFARKQDAGSGLLMLDFGAARRRGGTWGASLRSGTFFSNDEVHDALQAAADGYNDHYRQGEVTIVYLTTNANLVNPGGRFAKFDKDAAREAGEQQVSAIRDLDLHPHESVAVGGDIEPGYDTTGSPEVSIELVAGAVKEGGGPYYNVGTAPCKGERCVNGWTPEHICEVSAGGGRQALPEIYFAEQAEGWTEVKEHCDIKLWAGASASPLGDLSPKASWRHLRRKTRAEVGHAIVVFPG
jgi:hypothetical protein